MDLKINISKNQSARQAMVLYISTLLGVLIGMGVSVLNTRALPPAEYGDVRYVNNLVSFFAGILLLGYFVSSSRLLALSKTKEEADRIKGGSLVILGITGITLIIVILLCGIIHQFVLHKNYAYLFYSVLPVCIFPLLLNYINTTSQGDNSISTIAFARVLPSFFYLIIAYWIYHYFNATPQLMLWLNNGIAVVILLLLIFLNRPSFKDIKNSLNLIQLENKKYGRHVYYGSIANISIVYIAGISLGLFATNNTNVAFYTLALTITTPLAMAPSVIGTTFFKKFASQDKISSKVIKGTLLVSGISLIGFDIIIFPLVNFLYNSSYQSVALFSCYLALASTAQGIGDVFNRFLGAHGQGRQLRNGAWLSGFISIIGYTIGIYIFDLSGAIATRVLSSVAYLTAMVYYYRQFLKNESCDYKEI